MRSSLIPGLILLVGTVSGCNLNLDMGGSDGGGGGGGGDGVRHVGDYVGVVNKSDADVKLVEDKPDDALSPGDVMIICEGSFIANVDTNIDGDGNLVIEMAADVASIFGCEIQVVTDGVKEVVNDGDGDITSDDPMPDVKSIEVNGNGSIALEQVAADELDILVSGAGQLNIGDIQVTTLRIDLEGKGDASLAGNAENADLRIHGNGDLRAQKLTVADTLNAYLDGTGNGVITVLGTVNAEIHGDTSLEIYGGAEPGQITEVDGGEVIFH